MHAIVMGSSMAGLLAARVLSDSFERVTVLERDDLDDTAEPRKGVPQGRHVHNLLAKGDAILDRLFPGLLADLSEHGAVRVDWSNDVRWHHHGVWKARVPTGVESYLMSRPLLEWRVREHLGRVANVVIRSGFAVEELLFAGDQVRGVRGEDRRSATIESVEADLVVDCTGRGSRTPKWLEAAGFGEVECSKIHSDVVYATRVMRAPKTSPGFKVLAQVAPPPGKRSAVMFSIEDGLWMVTLFGYHGEHPPADDAGWLGFARGLVVSDAFEAITSFQPLSGVSRFHFPFTQRRHFERLARLPHRLVVLGDAVCSFNPIYGQGMTSAALQAEALETELSATDDLGQVSQNLRHTLARVVEAPWQAVASEDFRHAETTGDRMRGAGFINWYTRRLHRLAATDPKIVRSFLDVMHMQASVSSLFSPSIVIKVLARSR